MKLTTRDKLALFGVTIGWLILGAVVSGVIYAFYL
jgi:hypothetical protein